MPPPRPSVERRQTEAERVAAVARELRSPLTALLHALAGDPPRPVHLTRELELDKSLASRLVQATKAASDAEFLHVVPSPTGLRILLGRATSAADARLLARTQKAVDDFAALLDALPGGRQTLDALIGEEAGTVRERREQMARQASYKANSFLFGHCCDVLTTSLFLVPAGRGKVDAIEVHRRIGLQRLSAAMTLPLLSVRPASDDPPPRGSPVLEGLWGSGPDASSYFAPDGPSPVPELALLRDGPVAVFAIPAHAVVPPVVTAGVRVCNADEMQPQAAYNLVRNYMLHTPCRILVREVFLAQGLWPDAHPEMAFCLPSPSGTPLVPLEPGRPHHRRLNLSARIEQLPTGEAGLALRDAPDHKAALLQALSAAGVDATRLRGWRCRMVYPVPLVEMQLGFRYLSR